MRPGAVVGVQGREFRGQMLGTGMPQVMVGTVGSWVETSAGVTQRLLEDRMAQKSLH